MPIFQPYNQDHAPVLKQLKKLGFKIEGFRVVDYEELDNSLVCGVDSDNGGVLAVQLISGDGVKLEIYLPLILFEYYYISQCCEWCEDHDQNFNDTFMYEVWKPKRIDYLVRIFTINNIDKWNIKKKTLS